MQECKRTLDPMKVQALTDMPPPNSKKELQSFFGILNYLSTFSPVTAEVCKPLWKLMSGKADWEWNRMCQNLYDKAKKIIKKDACMKFYDAIRPQFLETDASIGARLLQIRHSTNCGHNEVPDNAILWPNALVSKLYSVLSGTTVI